MFALWDTFNDRAISRHRTIENVAKASNKHSNWWHKNGNGSYIPTTIRNDDGTKVDDDDLEYFMQCCNYNK